MPRRFAAVLLLLLLTLPALAAPRVVATILPVHSLVAGVMEGVAEPHLLLPPGASPHSYALVPSEARRLSQADLIVWIGAGLEQFMQKPLQNLAGGAAKLELAGLPALTLLPAGSDHQHQHDAAATAHDYDPHLWLDPVNAGHIVDAVAQQLAALDPDNAPIYRSNAIRQQEQLQRLNDELRTLLQPVSDTPFLVFHDAYRYFEQRYQLHDVGALTLNPERPPGARTIAAARQRIKTQQIGCVFHEPQFEPSLAQAVIRGTDARLGVLDPIGADLPPGPTAYEQLLRNLGTSLRGCLER